MPASQPVIHLLPNAHLDPVWLWDRHEGLNEAESTVCAVLDLMDEFPALTFNRGESLIYRHLQSRRADLFERILTHIATGRWDVVGGTYVQPDENLSSTETLCRQFEDGLAYFQENLGVRPTVSWQPDSFGHPRGWPEILSAFGMDGFAFTRPLRPTFAMEEAAFWWQARSGARVLCYRPHWRSYCNNRDNITVVLDEVLSKSDCTRLRNRAAYVGLGNHGGGPTRRHLKDVAQWAEAHPEVEVRYSTHHRFFAALRDELARLPADTAPVVEEEFGYCLRGCYSSVQKFKRTFRQAEAALVAAERNHAIVCGSKKNDGLETAWRSLLFNSFHDILPGSSIERAVEQQFDEVGSILHQARETTYAALIQLADQVDTRVATPSHPDTPTDTPFLVWNSQPRRFRGQIELEAPLDYRPFFELENQPEKVSFAIRNARGRTIPFQEIATEHHCMPAIPWRKRAVVPVDLPPFGWQVLRLGLADKATPPRPDGCRARQGNRPRIANERWSVSFSPREGLHVRLEGKPFWGKGKTLGLITVEDVYGSWGGMKEETAAWQLDTIRTAWKPVAAQLLETGPERATLWTRWEGGRSWLDLTFSLARGGDFIDVQGRLLWNERSARLQLIIPAGGEAVCDVPADTSFRRERGQVPVGRWFTRSKPHGGCVGVATDVLSDVDFLPGESRLTLARASRYGDDVPTGPDEDLWRPAVDCGELKFRLRFFDQTGAGDRMADDLLFPPAVMPVAATGGERPPRGGFGELKPACIRLLSLRGTEQGELQARVQNRGSRSVPASLKLAGHTYPLGKLRPGQIVTRILKAQ